MPWRWARVYATEKSYQEESNPREYILLNEEYQTLAVYPQFWDYPCHTDRYLLARKSANTLVVISTEDYSETYTLPEGKDLSYIDDERMILKEDNPGSTYYRFTCNLADLQGNPLSRNYAALCSDSSYEVRIPGEYFIGVVYEDGEIQKIDRDGQVLKTLSVDGVFNIYDLGNGFFVYETLPKENAYGSHWPARALWTKT